MLLFRILVMMLIIMIMVLLTSSNSIELSVLCNISKLCRILNGSSSLLILNYSPCLTSLVVALMPSNSSSFSSATHSLVNHHHPLVVNNHLPSTSLAGPLVHPLVDDHWMVVHLVDHSLVHHLPPPPLLHLLPTPRWLVATPRAPLPLPVIDRLNLDV